MAKFILTNISTLCFFLVKIKETTFLKKTIAECLACGKQYESYYQTFRLHFNSFVFEHYLQSDILTRCSYICLCVPTGLEGSPTNSGPSPSPANYVMKPLALCPPGTCFRQDMCIPTESRGIQCAPCPDGYTGDGIHCDDVDEVGIKSS